MTTSEAVRAIALNFAVEGRLASLDTHAGGHINESWVAVWEGSGTERRYLLQHVNRFVFRRPEQVMENLVRVTRHVAAHLRREGVPSPERRVLALVPTRTGATHHVDADGEVWRLMPWIEGTRSMEGVETSAEAEATAGAFGRFLRQLADLPGPPLFETIPRFHDTPARLATLEQAVATDRAARADAVGDEIAALLDRRPLAGALTGLAEVDGRVVRVAHNDAKIANILFDETTAEPLCVVDLDTVMPGLALHDFGDLVRSGASDSAEDERDLDRVGVRVPIFAALARGFVGGARDVLGPLERAHLVVAAKVIVFEQAARFLTDHLEGDRYYRIRRAGHNLDRARTQLRLLESLEARESELQRIVRSL